MRQTSQTELANIFFREIGGYLPKIELGISSLRLSSGDKDTLGEVYRYFHNIKGAASQVAHTGLSNSAGICEMVLGDLLENDRTPNDHQLEFLALVKQNIGEFCELPDKSQAAEESLLSNTLSFFQSLLHQLGPDNPIRIPSDILALMPDIELPDASAQKRSQGGGGQVDQQEGAANQLDCLLSLRSVVPLLKELAEYSPEQETLHRVTLPPMTKAVKTLAGLTASAGLKGHHSLLSQFLVILIKLEKSPDLSSSSTPGLLQEFLSYLDLVFSLPPTEGEEAAQKIQAHLDSLCDLLVQKSFSAEVEAGPGLIYDHADSDSVAPVIDTDDTAYETATEFSAFSFDDDTAFDGIADSTPAEDHSALSSVDDELLSIFRSECDEHLEVLEETVTQLAPEVTDRTVISESHRERLALLRRAAHTLKGAAAMTGFDVISQGAHSLEGFLDWLHDDCSTVSSGDLLLISEVTAAIRLMVEPAAGLPPNLTGLEAKLHAAMQGPSEAHQADAAASGWRLEDPADATEMFSQPPEVEDKAPAIESQFLLDIDDGDLLLDLSSGTEPSDHPADTTDQQFIDPELLAIFQSECDEHLQSIASVLNPLTVAVTAPTPVTAAFRESLGSIRRSIHTLKGAAAMTGFEQLASCSHSIEDLLDWLHDSAVHIEPQDLTIITEAIDIIESISLMEKTSSTIDITELVDSVRAHLGTRSLAEETAAQENTKEAQPETVVQSAVIQQAIVEPTDSVSIPGDSGNIRVKLADLDELVNIEGELVVVRGSVEKLLENFAQSLAELNTVKDTLRRKSQELEVGFEAQSLYGFGSGAAPQDTEYGDGATELSEFDPIELDRYSQLNLIIRSLNEVSIDINAIHTEMTSLGAKLQGQVARQQLAMGVMQEKLMRIRMTPLSSISRLLHRTVRQTAAKLGKNVQLAITGDDVYMDRFIWSRTIDPFSHILRNCIDHGIEDAETRAKMGKPQVGQITFNASQRGRFVVLKISDDGQGINLERLRQKLIEEGLLSKQDTSTGTDLLPYIFKPSISTRDDISQTSGRGVGLDVVLKNIQDLRGSVQVHNSPGKGVTFELRIPITLSVNRAIIFGLEDRTFAVPIHDIVEVRKFSVNERVETDKVRWNEQTIPLINLTGTLQLSSMPEFDTDILTLVIENADNTFSAVRIDAIEEQREIVIKDLGSHLQYVRGINGVTLTGEGAIIPILNLYELAAQGESLPQATQAEEESVESMEPLKVLVVDDSISVRYSISRLVESQAWTPFQAVDGIDALEKMENLAPDVIVLDIEMPRMNGFEFMGIIRNDERYQNIPVVMLTSRASEKHQSKARELGVDHYMVKPFQEEDFILLMSSMDPNHSGKHLTDDSVEQQ